MNIEGDPVKNIPLYSAMNTQIEILDKQQAASLICVKDIFVGSMSNFDRQARVQTPGKEVTEADYLKYLSTKTLDFTKEEVLLAQTWASGISSFLESKALKLNWPKVIYFIKTTGDEEGNAAYCRGNEVIAFPAEYFKRPEAQQILAHELFHILSRCNSALRDALYSNMNFVKCNSIELPPSLFKITNPDAPFNYHFIQVLTPKGYYANVVPILFSTKPYEGGIFFEYLNFRLAEIEHDNVVESPFLKPVVKNGELVVWNPEEVKGYLESLGKNTTYTVHPEECLADNFKLWVSGETNFPSPKVVEDMVNTLYKY